MGHNTVGLDNVFYNHFLNFRGTEHLLVRKERVTGMTFYSGRRGKVRSKSTRQVNDFPNGVKGTLAGDSLTGPLSTVSFVVGGT